MANIDRFENYDSIDEYHPLYYGFHEKNGRISIDTKRLKKLGYGDLFDMVIKKPRNTHYYVPTKKYMKDYSINILLGKLNTLRQDWNREYIPFLNSIKTPSQVEDEVRVNNLMYTCSSEDYDECDLEGKLAGYKRIGKYNEIIKSIYLQYIQKISIEFMRVMLIVMKKNGYNHNDFDMKDLVANNSWLTGSLSKVGRNKITELPHFFWFNLLNKIDNFLKHNTEKSYKKIADSLDDKEKYAKYVITYEESNVKYENGMYSGDWLKLEPDFIDNMLNNLSTFSLELCEYAFGETQDALWDSDEYLLNLLKKECYLCY